MIFILDNYDSFTYNLVQAFGELGEELIVERNDKIDPEGIARLSPSHLVLSPGPCTPEVAGISVAAVKYFAGRVPILGVCLGYQAIGVAFGGRVVRAPKLMHGKTSLIYHDGKTIFRGLTLPFEATRYHSLIIEKETLPDCLEITAWTEEGEIMGFRHKELLVEGVQFHPESILTREGPKILENFTTLSGGRR